MDGFTELRRVMVDCQLRTYEVTDRTLLAAADRLPREAFVPAELSHLAYLDQPVPLPGTSRALMAPMVIARMIQVLDLQPGEKVLEYGGGSGFGAALMAEMGTQATLWEPDAAAFAMAQTAIKQAGTAGVTLSATQPADSDFDAVLVSGACETTPESLFGLVRNGGRLIAIEGIGRSARVKLYQKTGQTMSGRPVFDAAAPILEEFRRKPSFEF